MNKTIIIGNLTRNPELRYVGSEDLPCCNFNVAVNKRVKKGAHPEAEFFRVTVWRQLAELCYQYLAKGRKVLVEGTISASAFVDNKGEMRASLELTADNVEFLSPRNDQQEADAEGFVPVDEDEIPNF